MWFFLSTLSVVFIAETQAYDETEAYRALYFSYSAYCAPSTLTTWSCKWCQDVTGFTIGGVVTDDALQAFVGYDSKYDRVTIAFRGTSESSTSSEIQDWMDNLDYSQESYPNAPAVNGHVHSGFYDAYKQLTNDGLIDKIQTMFDKYSGKNVLITGHSLGAALAQICALELKHSSTISVGSVNVITFGSPRWCDKTLATYYNSIIETNWRVVNKLDIVTTVPYTYMGDWGYYHTAQEIRYQDNPPPAYYECDAKDGEDEGSYTGGCWYTGTSVDDHLSYMGLEEGCEESYNSAVSYIDTDAFNLLSWPTTTDIAMCPCDEFDNQLTSTMIENGGMMSTLGEDENDPIIYTFTSGLDNVSKITLFVALAVGWILCLVFLCCWCITRRKLKNSKDVYFQLHDV